MAANELSKAWAHALEKDDHNYLFALWYKLTKAGVRGVGIADSLSLPRSF
ncbi:MAG: hypothetical protein WCY88_16185 [Spongiibacteraceae bacterium]